ncbi:hypothetical protein LCGC14_1476230 [marine sediment metagenome]|uniref:Uncharacterized protein n=1 Tax=marine sediment metagenome TaxID=412755 RepID=A0A0F9JBL6_9ZZZZ
MPRRDHLLKVRPEGETGRALRTGLRSVREQLRQGSDGETSSSIWQKIRRFVDQLIQTHAHEYTMSFMLTVDADYVDANPGTTYVDFNNGFGQPAAHANTSIDFSVLRPTFARVIIGGSGNEAGSDKGILIADSSDNELCRVEWDGSATKIGLAGDWKALAPDAFIADILTKIRVKGSSATEDITIRRVELQIRAWSMSVSGK